MRNPRTRTCIRIPVALATELAKTGSANQQIGEIIEEFNWETLTHIPDFDLSQVAMQQMTIQVSVAAKDALKRYCEYNGKDRPETVAQAIVAARQLRL